MNITRLNGDAAGERNCEFYMLIYSRRFSRAAPAKKREPRAWSNCNCVLALSSLVGKSTGVYYIHFAISYDRCFIPFIFRVKQFGECKCTFSPRYYLYSCPIFLLYVYFWYGFAARRCRFSDRNILRCREKVDKYWNFMTTFTSGMNNIKSCVCIIPLREEAEKMTVLAVYLFDASKMRNFNPLN